MSHEQPRNPDSDEITATIHAITLGERLKDRYGILAHLGSGGMADVSQAWDELFHRDVAGPAGLPNHLKYKALLSDSMTRRERLGLAVEHGEAVGRDHVADDGD